MAAANDTDTDADEQAPVQFHQYVDLPAELRIKIIHEFIAALREQRRSRPRMARPLPSGKLAQFAVIHSEWQHELEVEQELFGSLCLSTDDLPAFHEVLNQHRSRALSEVGLRVCIDDQVISFSGPVSGVVSRASDFIVNSVATILESVKYATSGGFQTTKAKLELYTQIMTPYDLGYPRFRHASTLPDGIDCDFSRLPLIHATRKLSQHKFRFNRWHSLRHPRLLHLSSSSMLSLATRMPNLEEADAGISSEASIGALSAIQCDVCPRLKTLRIPTFPLGPSSYNLARWASCWGDKIENLEIVDTEIPSFLRTFVKLDKTSGENAWPNLQVLKIDGACRAGRVSSLADLLTPSNGPIDALSAMAVALPWLPSIRDMTTDLDVLTGSQFAKCGRRVYVFFVVIKLHLCSGSSSLTISQPTEHLGRSGLSHTHWCGSGESDELSFKYHMQDTAAEVQDAVRIHHGRDLEIVWPETDEEPQSG